MRVVFIVVVLTILGSQYAEAKTNDVFIKPQQFLTLNEDSRGFSDVWDSIKNTALNALNSIKTMVQNTKERIHTWMESVKSQASEITYNIEHRIRDIRQKSKTILENLIGTGQHVKECFQKENDAVEDLLKQIMKYVSLCISDSMLNVSRLNNQSEVTFNETKFISNVELKVNKCIEGQLGEKCLQKVREDIFYEFSNIESELMASGMESRGIAEDIMNTMMTCSFNGLLDASEIIAKEAIHIITCVVKGK